MAVWFFPVALLITAWFAVIRMLWGDWWIDPQYGYGMLVPLLSAGLVLRRIPDTPPALQPRFPHLAAFVLTASCATLMLAVPFSEANPDWRPAGMISSLATVSITLCTVYLAGGLPWLGQFWAPVCFFLIAVPLPRNFEESAAGSLMSWTATATLEILHWLGYEATARGNLIVIPCGVLGIEEACSGVRSLQSGIMSSLFFGEALRLGWHRRLILVMVAVAAALLGNIIRSSLLAVIASRQGLAAVSSWHDAAGMFVLLLTLAAVIITAYRWRAVRPGPAARPLPAQSESQHASPFYPRLFLVCAAAMMLTIAGTEAWYRAHETEVPSARDWSLQAMGAAGGAQHVNIPPQTMRMLYYPDGFSERWPIGEYGGGQSFYFRWPAGRTSRQAIAMHRPEVCLSSIGMRLVRPLPPLVVFPCGEEIPFRSWLFEQRGVPVCVYQALLEEGRGGGTVADHDETFRGRIRAVLDGSRNRGQRMIEVALWNQPDSAAARAELERYLQGTLKFGTCHDPAVQ